jgi:hypothetical protein
VDTENEVKAVKEKLRDLKEELQQVKEGQNPIGLVPQRISFAQQHAKTCAQLIEDGLNRNVVSVVSSSNVYYNVFF